VKLLLIEEDAGVSATLIDALRRVGYEVEQAPGLATVPFAPRVDLVLLGIGRAAEAGLRACAHLREHSEVAIMALTACTDSQHRVAVLRLGADDCIVAPFDFAELHARIEAVLRRVRPGRAETVSIGRLHLDYDRCQAFVGREALRLTPIEFQLLAMLARDAGSVVHRERLVAEVWQAKPTPRGSRALDVHVAKLRHKVSHAAQVQAVRGIGYRLVAMASLRHLPAEPLPGRTGQR
jgi:DNA-binding response OmpR family regulator